MTINKLTTKLEECGVGYTLGEDNKINGLSFTKESTLTDAEAWELVEQANLKTEIIPEKPVLDEKPTLEEIKTQLESLTMQVADYEKPISK